jgi:hypothetical protein
VLVAPLFVHRKNGSKYEVEIKRVFLAGRGKSAASCLLEIGRQGGHASSLRAVSEFSALNWIAPLAFLFSISLRLPVHCLLIA